MLCLKRRVNESILIDGKIEIKVLLIKGGTVMLGIDAPKEIVVLRKELVEKEKADVAGK